ncbi:MULTISPECIES: flagellar protein FlgN [unclassified Butyrivibrio]|uniref:flagellar protein FlgN n=1 Tax=unclassified Butyrivibrio TaxID=2639466 RepID=UPI001FA771E6|nr:flagellar protein FlgN [Butyrivibrio sp. DSM 10294]MDC7293563.1 flagellar protein FlgN [Butyrivibrio sp. DSM 10294]
MIPVASLMENLVDVLDKECTMYEQLLELSSRKTVIIIKGDLEALAKITDEEQYVIGSIQMLEKQRETAMKDIANVLNKDVDSLKLTDLIVVLEKRPEDQKNLAVQRDRLRGVTANVRRVNGQNQELLKSSLEMVQFEMNIIQASKSAPQTANYSRALDTTGDCLGYTSGGFDAKQ